MNSTTAKKLAKELRDVAKEYLAQGLSSFKGEADMIAMFRNDAKDLREVASLIRRQDLKKAWIKAYRLDTAVREIIPDNIWDAIETELDEDC